MQNDWKLTLDLDAQGNLLSTMSNYEKILMNDPVLANIVFNEMSGSIDVKGTVPWKRSGSGWKQTDMGSLDLYIEKQYGIYSPSKCRDTLHAVLSSDRRYNPIKIYIESHRWDGKKRLDSLMIDYLSAEDTDYVKAVTRKTFCAAIARVYNPGIKFDNILVLSGKQGIGKSTLFSKMGGRWYSDSMTIADMKDKTAAEKLQGIWLMELSELAGLRKVDVETVKSFLSRSDDQFRVPYGTYVESHPRRSILVATTNTTDGFLRDITGNRRFWPIILSGSSQKRPWDLTEDEIGQIWAEAYVRYKDGESLYLTGNIQSIAVDMQKQAMEDDPRMGLVGEYLNAEKKEKVCLMELWCECLKHDRQDMKKRDAYELEAILQQIGGWDVYKGNTTGKTRISGYGIQKTFIRTKEELSNAG